MGKLVDFDELFIFYMIIIKQVVVTVVVPCRENACSAHWFSSPCVPATCTNRIVYVYD